MLEKTHSEAFMYTNKTSQAKKIGVNLLIMLGIYILISLGTCLIMFFSADPTQNIFLFSVSAFLLSGIISGLILGKLNKGSRASLTVASLLFSFVVVIVSLLSCGKLLSAILNSVAYFMTFNLFVFLAQRKRKKHRIR